MLFRSDEVNGPYTGIDIHLQRAVKSRIVHSDDYTPPKDDSLTAILDALALAVHGRWYWYGGNRIDFISRGCHEYAA